MPIADPAQADDAQRFADTVIQQLRAGAPFPVMAAQFSQSQTALQGGSLGWVQANQVDPAVLRVIQEMPVGAISNPIRVPGGPQHRHRCRRSARSARTWRPWRRVQQVFVAFVGRLDPEHPTDQQRQVVEQAHHVSDTAKDCDAMAAAAKAANDARPSDAGEVRVDQMPAGPMHDLLASLPVNKPSQPLISPDGVGVVMVCSRDTKNLGIPDPKELTEQILDERAELASRQLMRDLQRRAVINLRS